MRYVNAVAAFLQSVGLGNIATGLDVTSLKADAAPLAKAAIMARFAAVAPAAEKKLTDNRWLPLPSQRVPAPPWHTLVGSTIYYLIEAAIAEHGVDNAVAGIMEAMLLPAVAAAIGGTAVPDGAAYIANVSGAIADALVSQLTA